MTLPNEDAPHSQPLLYRRNASSPFSSKSAEATETRQVSKIAQQPTDPTHTILAWNEFGNKVAEGLNETILTPPTTQEALDEKMRIMLATLLDLFENNIWLFMVKGDFFAVTEMNRLSPDYQFSAEWTPADDLLLKTLMQGVDKYLTDWTSDIRTEAAETIAEHAGESSQQIGDAVAQVIQSESHRGTVIARTEIMRAFNKMAEQRYDNAGLKKIWLTARDPKVCEMCEPLDGQDLEEINMHPPAHPLCRCTIIPMLKE
jgi:SPP1 gp7 family putative phage head morphogenesis protein